jgi:hypothetical protein
VSDTTDDIPTPADPAVALAMERMRRVVEVGFERQSGALALLVQRYDHTAETLADHATRIDAHDTRIDTIERGETDRQKRETARVDELYNRRWPLPLIASVVAVGGLGLSAWAALGR